VSRNFDGRLISDSRERLSQLIDDSAQEGYASKDHLQRFVQELSTALEELTVAEEELRVQGDELAASVSAIDAERERYGELFEFAPDAYLVTDDHGRIVQANGAASRMLGVPARYMEGKLLVSFVAEAFRHDLRDLLASHGRDGGVSEQYLQVQPRDRQPFTAEVRVASGKEKGQRVLRWLIRDITQRLGLEDEIRFLHSEVELLATLSSVARLTAEPRSLEAMLDQIVGLASQAVPACEFSVALAAQDRPRFAATSGDRAHRLDAAEVEEGDGPCLAALRAEAAVETPVEEAERRWPRFGAVARESGLAVAYGYPLITPGGQRGVLNVYAFRSLDDETRSFIPLLADQVVIALTNAELYEGAHTLAGHLQRALESRGVIEQAKGVLIARQGCTDEQAFDILRRASQRLNRKLRDVAADLVAHVQAPKGPEPVDPFDSSASIARARTLEGRARYRADEERARAQTARESATRAQQQTAATHERARALHERAAELQRRHQVELAEGETAPAPVSPP